MKVLRPYEVSFKNESNWINVYAYTFSYDGENVTEYSGPWPGTKVEGTFSMMNRKFIYSFAAEAQPQFIIWNNGGGYEPYGEEAAQTGDLEFVNGKEYSVYPEITSVKISGSWNNWDGPEMEAIEYANNAYYTTIDLTKLTDDQEFKLVVNGEWIGYGELTLVDDGNLVSEGSENGNFKLKGGTGYDIVAFWQQPGANVKEGWSIEVVENTTVGIDDARANAAKKSIHNLKGQQLQEMQRGVNIVNGKKVTVK